MTHTEARDFVANLRANYPRIVSGGATVASGSYCVGGAYLDSRRGTLKRLHDWWYRVQMNPFPAHTLIADALQTDNDLGGWAASRIARAIIHANDAGNFDRAWRLLEEALCRSRDEQFIDSLLDVDDKFDPMPEESELVQV